MYNNSTIINDDANNNTTMNETIKCSGLSWRGRESMAKHDRALLIRARTHYINSSSHQILENCALRPAKCEQKKKSSESNIRTYWMLDWMCCVCISIYMGSSIDAHTESNFDWKQTRTATLNSYSLVFVALWHNIFLSTPLSLSVSVSVFVSISSIHHSFLHSNTHQQERVMTTAAKSNRFQWVIFFLF